MSHALGRNVSVLRRWAHHSDGSLPPDWSTFQQKNPTEAMVIEREDPLLVSLLRGDASATALADAIEGKLSARPESYESRQKAERQARMQYLSDHNPWQSGNMTEALEVEGLSPELAKRLRKEAGVVGAAIATPVDQLERQRLWSQQREARAEAMNRAQGRLRRGFPN